MVPEPPFTFQKGAREGPPESVAATQIQTRLPESDNRGSKDHTDPTALTRPPRERGVASAGPRLSRARPVPTRPVTRGKCRLLSWSPDLPSLRRGNLRSRNFRVSGPLAQSLRAGPLACPPAAHLVLDAGRGGEGPEWTGPRAGPRRSTSLGPRPRGECGSLGATPFPHSVLQWRSTGASAAWGVGSSLEADRRAREGRRSGLKEKDTPRARKRCAARQAPLAVCASGRPLPSAAVPPKAPRTPPGGATRAGPFCRPRGVHVGPGPG